MLGLVAIAVGNILFGLSDHGFLNGDESLYVESAREMLQTGNWVVPTLNGLPYLEKPPLIDWMLLIAFQAGGVTELAARSVPLLASVGMALALARFSSLLRIGGGTRWIASYIFLTSLGVVVMSSVAMPDALLTGLFGIGCINFAAALRTASRSLARWSAFFLGLACLVKGLLPVALFALILAAYVAGKWKDRKLAFHLLRDPVAWLLLLGPLLAWIVTAEIKLPGSAYRFVVDEHVLRFLGKREPADYYTGSVFYYVPRLFAFAFPWIAIPFLGWAAKRGERRDESQDTRNFLWACVWIPFVFFSLSEAKANYYVILCIPPLALLAADYLPVLVRKEKGFWTTLSIAVPALALLAIGALLAWAAATGRAPRLLAYRDGSFAITQGAELALCLTLLAFMQMRRRMAAMLGTGLLIVPVTFQLHSLLVAADKDISAKEMAAYITSEHPGKQVFLYQDYEAYGSLPIYLDRVVPVIDSRSLDHYFGRKLEPNHRTLVTERDAQEASGALVVVQSKRGFFFNKSGLGRQTMPVYKSGNATLYQVVQTIAPARMYTVQASGPLTARTIAATIDPLERDRGKTLNIYSWAVAPDGRQYMQTPAGWKAMTEPMQAVRTMVVPASGSIILPVADSLNLSMFVGTIMYVGMGPSWELVQGTNMAEHYYTVQ